MTIFKIKVARLQESMTMFKIKVKYVDASDVAKEALWLGRLACMF